MTAEERGAALEWATALTTEAAQRARAMLESGALNTVHKANGTLVTDIDRETERFLREAIRARYPDHSILGEEFGQEGEISPDIPLWALDPVDGTTNLANGLPYWCVSVGLIADGRPAAGVVIAPMLHETFAAAAGVGATLNGHALPQLAPGGPLGSEDPYGIDSSSARYRDFSRMGGKPRTLGSAALDVSYVGAGRFFGCQMVGVSLYDIAAAACIATATGAEMIWHETGAPYDPLEHVRTGPQSGRLLLIAPPATMVYVRESLEQIAHKP